MKKFEVVFYEKSNGKCPVEDFLDELEVKMHSKLIGLLEVLDGWPKTDVQIILKGIKTNENFKQS